MISSLVFYAFKLIIFNIVFPLIIALAIDKFDSEKKLNYIEVILCSFGLGPALSSLTLYYSLLLFPHQPSYFYLSIIAILFTCFFLYGLSNINSYSIFIYKKITEVKNANPIIFRIFVSVLLAFIVVWQLIVYKVPVIRHDTLEYAIQGTIFYSNKVIEYKNKMFDPASNFYYVGRHGFTFPLFVTLEKLFNEVFHTSGDFYFRSISGYYWILILILIFYWLHKKDFAVALTAVACLAIVPAFASALIYYHIDTYRMFFLIAGLGLLLRSLTKDYISIFFAGVVMGIMANSHSLGALFSGILILLYFFFCTGNIKNRFVKTILLGVLVLLFGGIHYFLDIILGTGWLIHSLGLPHLL